MKAEFTKFDSSKFILEFNYARISGYSGICFYGKNKKWSHYIALYDMNDWTLRVYSERECVSDYKLIKGISGVVINE